jgi:hypothetical protein
MNQIVKLVKVILEKSGETAGRMGVLREGSGGESGKFWTWSR